MVTGKLHFTAVPNEKEMTETHPIRNIIYYASDFYVIKLARSPDQARYSLLGFEQERLEMSRYSRCIVP
jgi:hypothetical protein